MIRPEDDWAALEHHLDSDRDREKDEDRRDLAIIFGALAVIGMGLYALAAYVSTHP